MLAFWKHRKNWKGALCFVTFQLTKNILTWLTAPFHFYIYTIMNLWLLTNWSCAGHKLVLRDLVICLLQIFWSVVQMKRFPVWMLMKLQMGLLKGAQMLLQLRRDQSRTQQVKKQKPVGILVCLWKSVQWWLCSLMIHISMMWIILTFK